MWTRSPEAVSSGAPSTSSRSKTNGAQVLPLISLSGDILNAVDSGAAKPAPIAYSQNCRRLLRELSDIDPSFERLLAHIEVDRRSRNRRRVFTRRWAKTTLRYFHIIRCGQMKRPEIVSRVRIEGPDREGLHARPMAFRASDARPGASRPALLRCPLCGSAEGFRSFIETRAAQSGVSKARPSALSSSPCVGCHTPSKTALRR